MKMKPQRREERGENIPPASLRSSRLRGVIPSLPRLRGFIPSFSGVWGFLPLLAQADPLDSISMLKFLGVLLLILQILSLVAGFVRGAQAKRRSISFEGVPD